MGKLSHGKGSEGQLAVRRGHELLDELAACRSVHTGIEEVNELINLPNRWLGVVCDVFVACS